MINVHAQKIQQNLRKLGFSLIFPYFTRRHQHCLGISILFGYSIFYMVKTNVCIFHLKIRFLKNFTVVVVVVNPTTRTQLCFVYANNTGVQLDLAVETVVK